MAVVNEDVKDLSLAAAGRARIEWALQEMPVVRNIMRRFTEQRPRPYVDDYTLADGCRIRLLVEGRLVNLAAAEGHPSAGWT